MAKASKNETEETTKLHRSIVREISKVLNDPDGEDDVFDLLLRIRERLGGPKAE